MNRKQKLAWAAGFYDGEGSSSCGSNNGNPHSRIQLSIGQKNDGDEIAETLIKFQKAVKIGNIYKKVRIGKEINQHQYLISKEADVKCVLKLLWPYISSKKKNQARRALKLLKNGKRILKSKIEENKRIKNVRKN